MDAILLRMIFLVLILLFIPIKSVCQTTSASNEDLWVNVSDSPLNIRYAPRTNLLLIGNYSSKQVSSYKLGCVSWKQEQVKIHKTFSRNVTTWLKPRGDNEIFFEALDRKYLRPDICKKGKLSVIEAQNDDGTRYRLQ